MNWVMLLKYALQLAAYFARQSERRDIEKAVHHELEILANKRIRKAADARDDVMSGRVQPNPDDPHRRD